MVIIITKNNQFSMINIQTNPKIKILMNKTENCAYLELSYLKFDY